MRDIENDIKARVIEVRRDNYILESEMGELSGKLRKSFYREGLSFPVIGDYVMITYNDSGESIINSVCERKSSFSRVERSGHAEGYTKTTKEQVLAANFDYVFIVASLNNDFNLNRIARYISTSFKGNAEPVVILTKKDLCENPQRYIDDVKSLSDKVKVNAISSVTGEGMDELKKYFTPGKTVVFLGSSGVGKSTLTNSLLGEEVMKVNGIREKDSKGHHTTTHKQIIKTKYGASIIDTPGIRELGMWDADEGINDTFEDIAELIKQCRFSNCKHDKEPGCAVKNALMNGKLSQKRWKIYMNLLKDNAWGQSISADRSRRR